MIYIQVIVCDADDAESKCALGCQQPSPENDRESFELNDDEKIDENEVFEQAEEINLKVEIDLDNGSTDNQTNEQAAQQIKNELLPIYVKLNPFDDGETKVEVTVEKVEVCELVEKNSSLGDSKITEEETCSVDDTTSTRKKRSLSKIGIKMMKNIAKVDISYKSTSGTPTSVSSKILEKLGAKVSNQTKTSKNTSSLPPIFRTGVKIAESMSFKLENWMETMPDHMKEIPATLLAIPGTHNSHSHYMPVHNNYMSQDSPIYGQYGNYLVNQYPDIKHLIRAWGRCIKTEHGIDKQLRMGLRYFDFR